MHTEHIPIQCNIVTDAQRESPFFAEFLSTTGLIGERCPSVPLLRISASAWGYVILDMPSCVSLIIVDGIQSMKMTLRPGSTMHRKLQTVNPLTHLLWSTKSPSSSLSFPIHLPHRRECIVARLFALPSASSTIHAVCHVAL